MAALPPTFAARVLSFRWPLLAIAAIWLVAAAHLHERQQQALALLAAETTREAQAIADSIDQTLREIDQALLYVRALRARDGDGIDLRPWVNSAEIAHGRLWPISIADRNGKLVLSDLRRVDDQTIDFSDRPQFQRFAGSAAVEVDDGLFVATPVFVDGRWTIACARPLMTQRGVFDGIVMLLLNVDALIPSERLARNETITVTGLDGIIRASRGGRAAAIGQPSASAALQRVAAEAGGAFVSRDPLAGTRRVTGFHRAPGRPLLVEVSLPADQVPAWFGDDSFLVLGMALVLTVAALLIGMRHQTAAPRVHALGGVQDVLLPAAGATAIETRTIEANGPPGPTKAYHDPAFDHLSDTIGTSAVAGIIAGFLQSLPEQLHRMRSLADAGEIDTLLHEAQALTRSAATIGLDQLAAAASELERDVQRRLVPAIAARLDRIDLLARPGAHRLVEFLHDHDVPA